MNHGTIERAAKLALDQIEVSVQCINRDFVDGEPDRPDQRLRVAIAAIRLVEALASHQNAFPLSWSHVPPPSASRPFAGSPTQENASERTP